MRIIGGEKMDNQVSDLAGRFMESEDGKRIAGKQEDIRRIAASRDGEDVKTMLRKAGFEEAVRQGDTAALRDAVSRVIRTESGARLLKNLQELMGR